MNQTAGRKDHRAVVCLFCGLHTPVSSRLAGHVGVSIIRCCRCGKEAPYPAATIIDSQDKLNFVTPRVRAAGFR
jgi:hypothetical protein